MIKIRILIITGRSSYSIVQEVIKSVKNQEIDIKKASISVSAFLSEQMTENILNSISLDQYKLVLIPGFIQWDTRELEKKFSIAIKKGPEFASDIPMILKNLDIISLSSKTPANKLFHTSSTKLYEETVEKQLKIAKNNIGRGNFYINEKFSDTIIGDGIPPLIIAEIVNCTDKTNENILKKANHYLDSGADIIDIGCIANQPDPTRVKEIISFLKENCSTLLSIDSMDSKEILSAVDAGIDLVLSLDIGNYEDLMDLPKDLAIVILPTNIKEGYFPKDPEERVQNLIELTRILKNKGFTKLIADPLLETPIAPGICNSLEAYSLYNKKTSTEHYEKLKLPLFFGISNVVELIDADSIGVNALLASMAIELGVNILFTVEHSAKLMYGVRELKECMKLNYISKNKKVPPINVGIQYFKAKGKITSKSPVMAANNMIMVDSENLGYDPDSKGYFKLHVDHYSGKINVLFFSTNHELLHTIIGEKSENLSKKIIEMELTCHLEHINYLGRELYKAESCLVTGKPYIQDE